MVDTVLTGEPYSKERQLFRGEHRAFRHRADSKEWQTIIAAKRGPCRACLSPLFYGTSFGRIEYHHLVSRAQGGDDTEDNIVPLHHVCHMAVTNRGPDTLAALAASLTDSERAYVVGKLGEDGLVRLFGATR